MSGTRFSAELTHADGIPLLRAHGEIDLYTVAEFERALREGLESGDNVLIVDLDDAAYIDSSGLSALVSTYRAMTERHGTLYIVANPVNSAIRRVLEITRLDLLLQVRMSVGEVLNEAKSRKIA